jgi:hypothetical protein
MKFEELGDGFSSASLLRLSSELEEKNWISGGAQVDLLSMGLRANARLYLRYRFSAKMNLQMMVPRDIAQLANEEFMERTNVLNLEPSVNGQLYAEHALGASYIINDKLTIGATLKRLNGVAAIQTQQVNYTIESDPETNRLRLEGEMLVNMAPNTNSFEDFDPTYAAIKERLGDNGGWAIDLGGTYQLTPKLQLGLSITDLGSIKWSTEAKEFRTSKASLTFVMG